MLKTIHKKQKEESGQRTGYGILAVALFVCLMVISYKADKDRGYKRKSGRPGVANLLCGHNGKESGAQL